MKGRWGWDEPGQPCVIQPKPPWILKVQKNDIVKIGKQNTHQGGSVSRSALSNSATPRAVAHQAHGILHARILEWVAISFSIGSSRPRDRTCVSCIAGRFYEIQGSPYPPNKQTQNKTL